jgi:hypothetical protein
MKNDKKQVTVSAQTLAYIECLRQEQILYECVFTALEMDYGERQTEKIMRDNFYGKSRAIRDFVFEYLCSGIGEKDFTKGIDEI